VKKGSAPIRRAAIVAPPSRRLSGGDHARRVEGEYAPGQPARMPALLRRQFIARASTCPSLSASLPPPK
jgi:hypothetical protein